MQGRLASMTCLRRAADIPAGIRRVICSQSLYIEVTTLLRACSSMLPQCLVHSPAIYQSCCILPRKVTYSPVINCNGRLCYLLPACSQRYALDDMSYSPGSGQDVSISKLQPLRERPRRCQYRVGYRSEAGPPASTLAGYFARRGSTVRAADSFRLFCGVLSVLKSMHSRGMTVRRVRPSMLRITSNGVNLLHPVRAECAQPCEGLQPYGCRLMPRWH